MVAVDTNIVVRILTGDDVKQTAAAKAQFGSAPILIAKTVLLETAWVLRSIYGYEDQAIHEAFTRLLGLRNVHAEDEPAVTRALALMAQGIEFADAIHLSSRPPHVVFVSFDRPFIRRATRAGVSGARILE